MANGYAMALKLVLKTFGLNPDEIEKKVHEGAQIVQEFDLNELRAAMQMILDYKQDRIKNELRMKAIMSKLEISDPALLMDLLPPTNHEEFN